MKSRHLLVLFLFGPLFFFGQTGPESIVFVPIWEVGESYSYRITKIKQRINADTIHNSDTSVYHIEFMVADTIAEGYRIKWRFKKGGNRYFSEIPEEMLENLSDYSELNEVIYTVDHFGSFIEIENWKEFADMMSAMFAQIMKSAMENGENYSEGVMEKVAPILSVYQSKEGIEQLAFKEIQFFHLPMGSEFSTEEDFAYEELLPNMFGGKPIRGEGLIHVENVDFENATCVLKQELALNPDDTKRIIETVFKKMEIDSRELKKKMKKAKFDIRDNHTYEFRYLPAQPIRIETQRKTFLNMGDVNVSRIDKIIIELLGSLDGSVDDATMD